MIGILWPCQEHGGIQPRDARVFALWRFEVEETEGSSIYRDTRQQCGKFAKKVVVVHLTHTRGHCSAFWPSIPPLQVAPSFACSVASLSRSPGHQLPGGHSLRHVLLADYLLGWGGPSTCLAGHGVFQCTPTPHSHQGHRRLDTPNKKSSLGAFFSHVSIVRVERIFPCRSIFRRMALHTFYSWRPSSIVMHGHLADIHRATARTSAALQRPTAMWDTGD